ncbi:hypothetical protein GCM10027190_16970 [Spirosoma areae]
MVYTSVAERFGQKNGSQITETAIYEQVIEENTTLSRAACSIAAGDTGECGVCSS